MSGWISGNSTAKLSVRWRLTVVYSLLFLICGAALLSLVYVLVRQSQQPGHHASGNSTPQSASSPLEQGTGIQPDAPRYSGQAVVDAMGDAVDDTLTGLLRLSALALAVMTVASVWVGWFIAGRVLAPVHAITTRARQISADSLDERIALAGRTDEIHEMAATFDSLLDRIQSAVESEKRLVAVMSHELRTPLANQQIALDVALADPDASLLEVRHAAQTALDQSRRANLTIESLLNLARAQDSDRHHEDEPVDLGQVAAEVVDQTRAAATAEALTWHVDLDDHVRVTGDRVLLQQAIQNLLQNAVRHNVSPGVVKVALTESQGHVRFTVSNTGPIIAPHAVANLTLPFRRGTHDRIASAGGIGLGLAIVQAITEYHQASLTLTPRDGGGLDAQLQFSRDREIRDCPRNGVTRSGSTRQA
jgi:signal transduction histidine kinase